MRNLRLFAFTLVLCFCAHSVKSQALQGKIICLDPGHGGTALTDAFRQGPTGEREEWVNLRVALILKNLLEEAGARVLMTRETDQFIALGERAEFAKTHDADIFVSIHHNATADTAVNFPIIYFHGNASENQPSVRLANHLGEAFRDKLFNNQSEQSVVSDHVIFPKSGAGVLRGTYGMPAVIAEASFFSNPSEEQRLKEQNYNQLEAEAYYSGIVAYFEESEKIQNPFLIHEKNAIVDEISPFSAFQEAERMNEDAKKWRENYVRGVRLAESKNPDDWREAYDLFTLSARSFPDSYLSGKSHEWRARLLEKLGQEAEARTEFLRVKEHYPTQSWLSPPKL